MIRKKLIAIVAAVAMVGMIQTAQASLTLAQLAAGQTLSIDDKIFSGFSYQARGLTSFDPNQIIVKATEGTGICAGVDYLTWSGNISLASGGVGTADLLLNYIVTANPGTITMIDQSYTGGGGTLNGLLTVDETAAIGAFGGTVVGNSHLQIGDNSDPPAEVGVDNLNINPSQSILYVTKDIGFAVTSPNGGFVSISQVTQSFHQIPEPTTLIAGALLLLPFGASTLRILRRRNRAAQNN